MAYTEDDAIAHASRRAFDNKGECFTVYRGADGALYVRASRAAPPQNASVVCIAQHWSGNRVQVRFNGARSEWKDF